ncbi:hypothetical protein M6B38_334965 [Iris pallida]|uniref:Uncharacterized protein n=1 Tax=Iris pallida TaxID=29817 RepID=A0AAX6H0Q5_IRIPA|nr:hypothetical protein M6B38_334965 [Iris pallida]
MVNASLCYPFNIGYNFYLDSMVSVTFFKLLTFSFLLIPHYSVISLKILSLYLFYSIGFPNYSHCALDILIKCTTVISMYF